jgi:hypothetical protein
MQYVVMGHFPTHALQQTKPTDWFYCRDGRRSLRDGFGGGDVPAVEQDERISFLMKTVKRLGVLPARAPGD